MKQSTQIAPKLRSGSQVLIEALERNGVKQIFGYPGGTIMPVYDALVGSSLKHYLCRHEQGAALAADAYGRVTRKAGVCMATSGPGATNLVTGIANAFMDSVPMVVITGQVPSALQGTDAFQEVDIFGITLPIVKHSYIVRSVTEIPHIVNEAFQLAQNGRPGPVLIDLPKDISAGMGDVVYTPPQAWPATDLPDEDAMQAAAEMLSRARRPLVIAGGGIAISDSVDEFRQFIDRTGLPVTTTLKGLGVMPADDPRYVGMLGMHGNGAANHAVQNCDLLMVVGARFDDRATGQLAQFAQSARIIHVDIDAAEISKLRKADVAIVSELAPALDGIRPENTANPGWQAQCAGWTKEFAWRYDAPGKGIYAPKLLRDLSRTQPEGLTITCDVGQHQMWVAQHCTFNNPLEHISSGGLGTMGYGLPAAIGAKIAKPDATVVCVSGDGSIMMNIQELATLKRYGIDVKILLLDNSALGLVRQWQEIFFEGNYSEVHLTDNPDFAAVARAFGIQARSIKEPEDVSDALEWLLNTDSAAMLHVAIDSMENVWPLVPPGKPNHKMMRSNP
ncbi:MAG: acetolactate synthase 2 catalytic subunit [Xanthomonadales bacterium]|nr:acetolactate synthase 2 catalytic subunit [Xanthomonadales bacterium]